MRRFPFQHKKQERERKVFPLKDTATYRGNIFWRASKKFQFAADRIIPDSFVFCVVLTFIVFIVAMVLTGTPPLQLLQYWYDGMWTQLTFAMPLSVGVVNTLVFLGSARFLGEEITPTKIAGLVVIVLGLFLISIPKK